MSVAKITDNGFKIIFRKTKALVIDAYRNIVMVAKRKNDLYLILEAKATASVAKTGTAKKIHGRIYTKTQTLKYERLEKYNEKQQAAFGQYQM